MNPRVKDVSVIDGYKLHLRFTSGEQGVYDCSSLLNFGIFREFQDEHYFRQARADHGTVVWPNGQDICPDTLYIDAIKSKGSHG
jgi:hypothetical protein